MATRSAAKAHRQSLKKRLRNRAVKSSTKTAVKNAGDAIAGGDLAAAREAVREAISALDRAAQKRVLHANSAGRRKSRLLLKFNAAVAAVQVTAEAPAQPPAKKRATRAEKPEKKAVKGSTAARKPKK